jgi:hypothetical protein
MFLCFDLHNGSLLAIRTHGMPVRVIVTAGPTADCTQAGQLIEGINAEYLRKRQI